MSDVLFASRAEKRVSNGVKQHVGIGMTEKPFFVLYFNTADDQFSPRDKAVYVIAVTDSHSIPLLSRNIIALARFTSAASVSLKLYVPIST